MKNNTQIRSLLRDQRHAHALRALRELDADQKMEPYLYTEIMEYQAYDPNVHTSEYAIQQDNVEMIQFLIENDLWTESPLSALLKTLQYKSSKAFIYVMTQFNLTLWDVESTFDENRVI